MCGIAGWVDFNRDLYDEDFIMDKMSKALAPRGPDASGVWKSHECCFAHRRLIVIDPENGRQPMSAEKQGREYIICYNGELYNTEEIRGELLKAGHTFSGHSDTEVLLHAYIEWGEGCTEKLNGIYAFAVWDKTERKLFLCRDRIGVKPLFYYIYDGGIIFASEIKALLCHPYVKPVVDSRGIASVMLLGPALKCGDGIFKGVSELKPAHCGKYDTSGFSVSCYWKLTAKPHTECEADTVDHVRELLIDSIERQLVSDVPLCTFLSGGLDSSIISAVAARKYRRDGKVLHTFSVDYKGNRENFHASRFQPDEDAPWIVKMSEYINSEHENVVIDTPQLTDALTDAVRARDLPGMADVDSSLYLFCKAVREKFPVAVSGECADEIFAGYPWYHNEEVLFADGFPWARSTAERAELLRKDVLGGIDPFGFVNSACSETCAMADYLDTDSPKDRRMREMFMLNFYWFMQVLLTRKDRMSMAHGLEVRVPFCDHRIAEYAYNIPWSLKKLYGREKGLVRKAMGDMLPEGVAWRKKSPYPKTHNPDYLNLVIGRFEKIVADRNSRLGEILDADAMKMLIETRGASFTQNWYGQLMQSPQLFAYLIQLEEWLELYNIIIEK